MIEEEKMKTIYDDVCCVVGRAAIILRQNEQPVTVDSINQMLQAHSTQINDAYMVKVYAVAKNFMAERQTELFPLTTSKD